MEILKTNKELQINTHINEDVKDRNARGKRPSLIKAKLKSGKTFKTIIQEN